MGTLARIFIEIIILFLLTVSFRWLFITQSPFFISLSLLMFAFCWRIIIHRAGSIWVRYTLVLIFLGGIMIVFVYASSMNRVFKLKVEIGKSMVSLLVLLRVLTMKPCSLLSNRFSGRSPTWLNFFLINSGVIILMARFILITLFIVVKLVQLSEGPLKF